MGPEQARETIRGASPAGASFSTRRIGIFAAGFAKVGEFHEFWGVGLLTTVHRRNLRELNFARRAHFRGVGRLAHFRGAGGVVCGLLDALIGGAAGKSGGRGSADA